MICNLEEHGRVYVDTSVDENRGFGMVTMRDGRMESELVRVTNTAEMMGIMLVLQKVKYSTYRQAGHN